MSSETIFSITIGVLLGGAITWVCAWIYYKKAGDQLIKESKKLKLTSDLILYKLQHPDADTELSYNSDGEVSGIRVNMQAKL